ncbi:hypothetical protein [Paenibacillus vulneris]|uniref:Uncharacterized protein n=1 Tax=Paenibacillus vulneris TaxID=1133364 RepID=A0ABW3UJ63_9BACL
MQSIPTDVLKVIKDARKHFQKAIESNNIARNWLEEQGLLGEDKSTDYLEIEDQYIDTVENGVGDLKTLLKNIENTINE